MNNDINIIAIIEGMLFIEGDEGLDISVIKKTLKIPNNKIIEAIEELNNKYKNNYHAITVINFAKTKYRITTIPKYYDYFLNIKDDYKKKKLPVSNLEVLSIIAYKQPITKMQIEKIRGVNSDYIINKLCDLELIRKAGRNEDIPGKPFLFIVSDKFMKEFNLKSLNELPKIDLEINEQTEKLFN